MSSYDQNNIFAKILRSEIPCDKVFESKYALAFRDINPQAPVHVLVIPKGLYTSADDFTRSASSEELEGFWRAVGETAQSLGLSERGFRLITNCGEDANQEVPHFHVHVLGGRPLGPMLGGDSKAIIGS
jgi:histidine triad (HIT) family protein